MNNNCFYINKFEKYLIQNINLSESASIVIEEDMRNFYDIKVNYSGFLNQIFTNFYQQANATISLRYVECITKLEKIYKTKEFENIDKSIIKQFISRYARSYVKELMDKVSSYPKGPKGSSEKFRINKINCDILRELDFADYYDNKIGKYLKAVFEEYTLLPKHIREQIFFKETYDTITNAIDKKKKIKIALNEKISPSGEKLPQQKYLFAPHSIVQDSTKSFNYLVGYSEKINDIYSVDEYGNTRKSSEVEEKMISCIRLSNISHASMQVSMSRGLSKNDIALLEEALNERTAMFLTNDVIDIKVKFTDKGLDSLKRQIYMRPHMFEVSSTDPNLYTFKCTKMQAIFYFFKFGWDATIIEPVSLKEEMFKRYNRSVYSYQGYTKKQIVDMEHGESNEQ